MTSASQFGLADWTLDRVLDWRVGLTPDAPFLVFDDGTETSFKQMRERARKASAALFEAGLRSGDRLALFARNSMDHVAVWFAASLIGAVDAPINPSFKSSVLEQALELLDVEIVVADAALLHVLAPSLGAAGRVRKVFWIGELSGEVPDMGAVECTQLRPTTWRRGIGVPRSPSDIMSILSTSGTTGPAKGVMVTHAQAYLTALQTVQGLRVEGGDVFYCAHPLFHMSPRFCVIYAALLTGTKICFDAGFSAARWIERIRDTGATVTIGHGPLLEMIYAQPERPDDSRTSLTRIGTSPFPRHIAADFERRFGLKGIETWGMTEVNIPCWHPADAPLRPGSCGRIREEWYEFRVVDPATDMELGPGEVGEFVVRPKLPWIVSPGYFRNPEATMKAWRNLWFHTGDGGYRDADGWVWFVDRLGDRIRRRAENISSYDIEIVANAHPAVLESAAIGVPSGFASDDDIKLCVLWRKEAVIDPTELLSFLALRLPHHMVPRYIEPMEEMPRTPTQKIRKSALRAAGVTAATWDRKAAGVSLRALVPGASRG
jgi:crotonobetaine/carnitine-CoA ligase